MCCVINFGDFYVFAWPINSHKEREALTGSGPFQGITLLALFLRDYRNLVYYNGFYSSQNRAIAINFY